MPFDIKTARPITQEEFDITTAREAEEPGVVPTPDLNTPRKATYEKPPNIIMQILKNLGKTAVNIPKDIYRTAKGASDVLTETIPQTVANVAVDPKYGAKTALRDVGAISQAVTDLPARGIANVAVQPLSKTVTDIGEYVINNPASTAFDILSLSPKTKVWSGIAKKVRNVSAKATRRGMGFEPKMLKGRKGLDYADDVAREVMKKELIPFGGSPDATYKNVIRLKNETGGALGGIRQTLQQTGKKAFNPLDLDDAVIKEFTKTFTTRADKNALREIRRVILDPGIADDLDFNKATELVQTLQKKGKFYAGTGASEANKAVMYQKASGIAREMLDDTVIKATSNMGLSNLAEDYISLKQLYRKLDMAEEGLEALRIKQATNTSISLFANPVVQNVVNRAILSTGREGAGIARIIEKAPIKSLYYTGRFKDLMDKYKTK